MTFRPIDLQVNLSHLNEVAKSQQHIKLQHQIEQAHHSAELNKNSKQVESTVKQTQQTNNQDSSVKNRKENPNRKYKNKHKRDYKGEELDNGFSSEDDEDKGHLIDTKR